MLSNDKGVAIGMEIIVIHVFDENRKINKDFTCEKELLVQHMKYFDKYLTESTSVDDIDISVHCDIKIFEWLMKYLKHKDFLKTQVISPTL
jgi:hypothetical protein